MWYGRIIPTEGSKATNPHPTHIVGDVSIHATSNTDFIKEKNQSVVYPIKSLITTGAEAPGTVITSKPYNIFYTNKSTPVFKRSIDILMCVHPELFPKNMVVDSEVMQKYNDLRVQFGDSLTKDQYGQLLDVSQHKEFTDMLAPENRKKLHEFINNSDDM